MAGKPARYHRAEAGKQQTGVGTAALAENNLVDSQFSRLPEKITENYYSLTSNKRRP